MKAPKQTTRRRAHDTARSERGGAMLFVLIIGTSLMFVAAYSLTVGVSVRRAAGANLQSKSAFFCAEQGLQTAKAIAVLNKGDWAAVLADPSATYGTWYPITGTCAGAGNYSFVVRMRDNLDDANQQTDTDGAVVLDSVAFRPDPYTPMATISGVISGRLNVIMSAHAQEGGAQNTFNTTRR